jgi:hypothetical protein
MTHNLAQFVPWTNVLYCTVNNNRYLSNIEIKCYKLASENIICTIAGTNADEKMSSTENAKLFSIHHVSTRCLGIPEISPK